MNNELQANMYIGAIVTILHPSPRDTGKVAALGPNIMSPEGRKLLPEGRRAAGSRPEGSNLRPEGDIIWPVGGNFPVSQGRGGAELAISYGRAITFTHPNLKYQI